MFREEETPANSTGEIGNSLIYTLIHTFFFFCARSAPCGYLSPKSRFQGQFIPHRVLHLRSLVTANNTNCPQRCVSSKTADERLYPKTSISQQVQRRLVATFGPIKFARGILYRASRPISTHTANKCPLSSSSCCIELVPPGVEIEIFPAQSYY